MASASALVPIPRPDVAPPVANAQTGNPASGVFIQRSPQQRVQGGYVVVMKDGSRIRAKGPYRVSGKVAILTLEDGTLASIRLDSIDREATETSNAK
jgi:hypothetical protein